MQGINDSNTWWILAALILGLPLLMLLDGCREPYEPDIVGFADLLVVEGRLTNDTAGSVVLLSRSYGFELEKVIPVSGALVQFESASGTTYVLPELENGRYVSDPAVFDPVIGESYRLYVRTVDGKEYVSSYEEMKATPAIESVDWQIGTKERDVSGLIRDGVYITLNTRDPENNSRYYRWTWKEVWEFRVPFPIKGPWVWEPTPGVVPVAPGVSTEVCFRNESSTAFLLGTSRQLDDDVIVEFPLTFVDARSGKLGYGYSIEVDQYTLSEEEYTFLQTLKKNTETTGSIFDPIPAEISGNIRNMADSTEVVIGYFGASTVTKDRIFIKRNEIDPPIVDVYIPFRACETMSLPLNLTELRTKLESGGLSFYDTIRDPFGNPVGFSIVASSCGDCRLSGSPDKPSFWPW
ncbi:MAG: DUF4249 domain-containing protein [Bacteroidia bacterium]|nr:DUF4249 domain-containing protein [Bacteroidia bacterium]